MSATKYVDELRLDDLPQPEKPLLHIYVGIGFVQPGEVALCGHVHNGVVSTDGPIAPAGYSVCVVCEALRASR